MHQRRHLQADVRQFAPRSTLKIALSFYQIIAQLEAVYSIDYYPPRYKQLINSLQVFNLHFFAWWPSLQPTCLGIPSLVGQLLFATLAPLVVVLMVGTVVKLRGSPLVSMLPFVLYGSFLVFPAISSRGFRALAPCNCFSYVGQTPTNISHRLASSEPITKRFARLESVLGQSHRLLQRRGLRW